MIAVCPNDSSHKRFITTAHIAEDWEVDEHGNWISTPGTSTEVTHKPDHDNEWTCCVCGCAALHLPDGHPTTCNLGEADLSRALRIENDNVWDDFPYFPRKDWRYEIAISNTNLGYWDWVKHRIEYLHSGGNSPCEECDAPIPENASNMANRFHEDSCSLYDPKL